MAGGKRLGAGKDKLVRELADDLFGATAYVWGHRAEFAGRGEKEFPYLSYLLALLPPEARPPPFLAEHFRSPATGAEEIENILARNSIILRLLKENDPDFDLSDSTAGLFVSPGHELDAREINAKEAMVLIGQELMEL
jgi:hypothetical protein